MKHLKVVGLTLLSISLISGCASTDDSLPKDATGNFVFPNMDPINAAPFVWDNSLSEALNVAKMAQPANVGIGMSDSVDGTEASIGRQGAGARLFDGALGLATSGLFGLAQSEALSQGVNRAVEWKPSIVDIVDKDVITENGKISYVKTKDYIADKIKTALIKEFPNIELGDALTPRRKEFKTFATILIKNENLCKSMKDLTSGGRNIPPLIETNTAEEYYDGKNELIQKCDYSFSLNITGEYQDKYIIVANIVVGHYLNDALTNHYEGYVIVPDIYFVNSVDSIKTDYAFVSKSGEKLLFKTP